MLEHAYKFYFIQNTNEEGCAASFIKLYRFKSEKSNLVYLVRVEVYPKHIYAVKFYLKNHQDSPNKYRLATNTNEPLRIINTCINIMLSIYNEDTNASFGFIGSNGIDEDTYCCTKRYRVYTKLMAKYFSDDVFLHVENKGKSAYLMLNRKTLEDNPNILHEVREFFVSQYDYFD